MVRTGRPRSFDRDKAVEEAMFVFWRNGYEGASISKLRASMAGGLNAPSFYAAFSSKDDLFKEVLDRYMTTYGGLSAGLWSEGCSPRDAIETTLRRTVAMQTADSNPRGCLLVYVSATCPLENAVATEWISRYGAWIAAGFERCVSQGVLLGQLPQNTNVPGLASTFHTFMIGINTQARNGATREELDASVTEMMRLWNTV